MTVQKIYKKNLNSKFKSRSSFTVLFTFLIGEREIEKYNIEKLEKINLFYSTVYIIIV